MFKFQKCTDIATLKIPWKLLEGNNREIGKAEDSFYFQNPCTFIRRQVITEPLYKQWSNDVETIDRNQPYEPQN